VDTILAAASGRFKMTWPDVHGRPRFAKPPVHCCTKKRLHPYIRTFNARRARCPWWVLLVSARSHTRTRSASSGAGCANHGLTYRAINLLVAW